MGSSLLQSSTEIQTDRRMNTRRISRSFFDLRHLGFGARRKNGGRRKYDRPQYVDWYEADLLAVVLGIFVLSMADAAITLRLLEMGAVEANMLMAHLIEKDVNTFVALKAALTGLTIVLLVIHKDFKLIKIFSVKTIIWVFLLIYAALIAYEVALLKLIPMVDNVKLI